MAHFDAYVSHLMQFSCNWQGRQRSVYRFR
jgi:hypothetical protein